MAKTTFFATTLQAKVVPEMMELSKEFREKAELFEELHNKYNEIKERRHKTYEEEVQQRELFRKKEELKKYLEQHIQQFKKNRQEWFFEHVETPKYQTA